MAELLTFQELRKANVARCEEVFHPLNHWTPTDWGCALAGEVGEACNAIKKLRRHGDGTNTDKDPATKTECLLAIGEELADIIIYADLLAASLGIDLAFQVRRKFNTVSTDRNSSHFL